MLFGINRPCDVFRIEMETQTATSDDSSGYTEYMFYHIVGYTLCRTFCAVIVTDGKTKIRWSACSGADATLAAAAIPPAPGRKG
jgi:hypothetical protein